MGGWEYSRWEQRLDDDVDAKSRRPSSGSFSKQSSSVVADGTVAQEKRHRERGETATVRVGGASAGDFAESGVGRERASSGTVLLGEEKNGDGGRGIGRRFE